MPMQMVSSSYHKPVLLNDCIKGLKINPNGIYVDATFGGGGHSKEILNHLTNGRLIAFDQDKDAVTNAIQDKRFVLVNQNFKFLKNNLRQLGIKLVDGILADLGVSSHQLDEAMRGFAAMKDGPLDMRMDQKAELDAFKVVNQYGEEDIARLLKTYGEVKNAVFLSKKIVEARKVSPISSTFQLRDIVINAAPAKKEMQYVSKVFQAIRIEVNGEMDSLEALLQQSVDLLKRGGRLVIISYHSLEDRMVKRFMRSGNFSGQIDKDLYGNDMKPFRLINTKVIKPDEKEIEENRRARSARLRIAERVNE